MKRHLCFLFEYLESGSFNSGFTGLICHNRKESDKFYEIHKKINKLEGLKSRNT